MRCLYCGKELALLKRWTGGGEFCSDAHRQRYQEEYNQLALNRLLQAKPPNDPVPGVAPKPVVQKPTPEPARPEVVREPNYSGTTVAAPPMDAPAATLRISESPKTKPVARELPAPAAPFNGAPSYEVTEREPSHAAEAPVADRAAVAEEPPKTPEPEVAAPAEIAGFFIELPLTAISDVAEFSRPDLSFVGAGSPAELPRHSFQPADTAEEPWEPEAAGLLSFPLANRASNYTMNGSRERRLDVRDFLRTAPVVEVELAPAGETGLATSSTPLEFSLLVQPPTESPTLWQEPSLDFAPVEPELGDLARLAFAADSDGVPDASPVEPLPAEIADNVETKPQAQSSVEVQIDLEPELVAKSAPKRNFLDLFGVRPAPVVVMSDAKPAQAEPPAAPAAEDKAAEHPVEQAAEVTEPKVEEKVEPAADPQAATEPLVVPVHPAATSRGKTVQVFSSAAYGAHAQVPRSTSLPLRPIMMFGPMPAPPKEAPKAVVKPAEPAPRPADETNPPFEQPKPNVELKKAAPPPAPGPSSVFRRPAFEKPADPKSKPQKNEARKPEPASALKPAAKLEPKPDLKQSQPEPEKPAPEKLAKDKKPEARDMKVKDAEKPVKMFDAPLPAPLAPPYPGTNTDLGLPRLSLQPQTGFFGRLPMGAKIAVVVVMLAVVGGVIAMSSKSGSATVTSSGAPMVVPGTALPTGDSGWITDWGSDPGVRKTRQISVLRSSQTYTDYRIEMEAQIESKAIGWVFRAADPKNFYVTKLEIVKPGLEPTIALIRFAVINGEEQARAQLPLQLKVRRDTLFKIRFDAVGSRFSTYVQDEKIDEWTDDHVKTGGVGMYSERGEVATLKGGVRVVPLVVKR